MLINVFDETNFVGTFKFQVDPMVGDELVIKGSVYSVTGRKWYEDDGIELELNIHVKHFRSST